MNGIGDPEDENGEDRPQNDAGDLLPALLLRELLLAVRLFLLIAIHFLLAHVNFLPCDDLSSIILYQSYRIVVKILCYPEPVSEQY